MHLALAASPDSADPLPSAEASAPIPSAARFMSSPLHSAPPPDNRLGPSARLTSGPLIAAPLGAAPSIDSAIERPTDLLARGKWQVPASSIAAIGAIVVLSGALYFGFFMLRARFQRRGAR
jgi:hypothetical protein